MVNSYIPFNILICLNLDFMMRYTPIILLLALFLVFLSACAEKKVVPEDPPRPALEQEAAHAWESQDFQRSQELYSQILEDYELEPDKKKLALRRLAVSAYENRDPEMALQASERWAKADPKIQEKQKWHEVYSWALKETQPEHTYIRYLEELYSDPDKPFALTHPAARELAEIHLKHNRYPEATSVLQEIYGQARTESQKRELEEFVLNRFLELDLKELEKAVPFMEEEKKLVFPHNIFWWAYYQARLEEDDSLWTSLHPQLREIAGQSELVHREPMLSQLEKWESDLGKPVPKIALALPLSGHHSSVGWDVLRGAGQAHWEMLKQDTRIQVKTINTNQPGWLDKLSQMENLSFVGGPLSLHKWGEIREHGLHKEVPFLTFMPSLEEEGKEGWRFFSSPQDQIRALLDLTIQELEITNFAIMYPEEDFGRTYAEIFWNKAQDREVDIKGVQNYPPDQPSQWNHIVSSFLGTSDLQDPWLNVDSEFQAVFIPDSLSRAQGLIPEFFYFNHDHLVFLGPMLWYQAHSPNNLEQQFFSLALSSGGWNNYNPDPRSRQLAQKLEETAQGEANFWTALGYDFVRFSARLGDMPAPQEHEEINQILAENNFDAWSMAPIRWDESGRAFQDLYVFHMDRDQLRPADSDRVKWAMEFRKHQRDMWIKKLQEQEEEKQEQ